MECDTSLEQNALINELIQGMEIARKLKADLSLPSSVDTRDSLLQRILSSYDKALLILQWNASISKPYPLMRQELKQNPKKRKMMPKWIDQVTVKIENDIEGPHEDGYSWRKYGQKDILGAKYPRNYYRCTFRKTKGCDATKQVQRSDEDPTILDITYRGNHTFCHGNNAVLPPKSPDMEEKPHDVDRAHPSQGTAYPFASPSTSFGCMAQDNHHTLVSSFVENDDPFWNSLSKTHLLYPNTPQSDCVPSSDELDNKNKPCADFDVTGIISPITSTTNASIFDFNFSLDAVGIDSTFPFNASGFLS